MTKSESQEVKEWLWGYREAVQDCRRLEDEYRQLVAGQEAPKAIEYGQMPGGHGDGEDLSHYMAIREDLLGRIARAKARMASALSERLDAIEELPTFAQRDVASMRYIQLKGCRPMGWDEIARRAGYSQRRVFDVHGQALEELHRMMQADKDSSKMQ